VRPQELDSRFGFDSNFELDSRFVWKTLGVPTLMILPFFLLLNCVHPQADDFSLGADWRESGVLAMLSNMYVGWSGRLLGLALAPLPFMLHDASGLDILAIYRLLCGGTLVAMLAAALWCSGKLLPESSRPIRMLVGLLLAVALVAGAPNPEQLVFWFTGVSFYTVPGVITLLIAVWLFTKAGDPAPIGLVQAGVVAAAGLLVAMGSEFGGLALILVVASSYAQRWMTPGAPRQYARLGLVIVVIAAGTLVVLLAPGNAVRLDALGVRDSMILRAFVAIPRTLLDVTVFLFRRLTNPALIGSMAILALVAFGSSRPLLASVSRPALFVAIPLAAALIAMAAGLWMGRMATGQMLEQRAQNQLHFILVASMASSIVLAARIGGRGGLAAIMKRLRLHDVRTAAVACLSLMLVTPQFLIAAEILIFHSREISSSISDRFARIGPGRVPGAPILERELVLPRLPISTAFFSDGLSEDPKFWVNVALARYSGVRTVRVEAQR
jgi:hypothetical protein